MLELRLLPARQGDALWIRWGDGETHQIMIDMGTEEVGEGIRDRLEDLPEEQRRFELLVVTHVDRDHIGGVLTALAEAEPLDGLRFDDVWFNGWEHLSGGRVAAATALESMGPAQGERLASWLRGQRWNRRFEGGPVIRTDPMQTIPLPRDLSLTVLGPTEQRLDKLKPVWKDEVEEALRKGRLNRVSPGLESYGPRTPPVLDDEEALEELADTRSGRDASEANGSSISLLLQWRGRRILLAGDAFAEDLIEGIEKMGGQAPFRLDAFKLPHHGSKKNVSDELVRAVDCPLWLFSTDGTQFRHPDAVAIARVLRSSRHERPTLAFNVPSTYNGWWKKSDWRDRFDYEVEYGTETDGLVLSFDALPDPAGLGPGAG